MSQLRASNTIEHEQHHYLVRKIPQERRTEKHEKQTDQDAVQLKTVVHRS